MNSKRLPDTKLAYLDFEQSIAELEKRIEALQISHDEHDALDISKELEQLEKKKQKATRRHLSKPFCLANLTSIASSTTPIHHRLHSSFVYRFPRVTW